MKILRTLTASLLVVLFIGCASTSTTVTNSGWAQTYGSGFSLTDKGAGFSFKVPKAPGSVHYILKPSGALKIGQTVTVTFTLKGTAKFSTVQTSTGQPAFRVMFQLGNDMYSAQGRYWSSQSVVLTNSGTTRTLVVKIDPALWSDVYGGKGTEHLTEFQAALKGGHLGITFGGTTGGYGHGDVGVGDSTFTLVNLTVK
jgi:hypothetical protein